MNAGELIMYDVRPELREVIMCNSPLTKKDLQMAFVNFCIRHDLVDLQCHNYTIGKHHRMRSLLGIDTLESSDIFLHLKGLVSPFSVQEREQERKKLIEMRFKTPQIMRSIMNDGDSALSMT